MSVLKEAIQGVSAAIDADVANAAVLLHARAALVGLTEVDVRAGGWDIKVDEPTSIGGGGKAAGPADYALASLISCQAITYQYWAANLGIKLDTVQIEAEADMDARGFFGLADGVRPGLSAVRLRVALGGPESPERYQQLAKTVDEHCPILDVFKNPVPVSAEVTVV